MLEVLGILFCTVFLGCFIWFFTPFLVRVYYYCKYPERYIKDFDEDLKDE